MWVTGTTSHFHPKATRPDRTFDVIWNDGLPRSCNVVNLDLQRSMFVSRDVFVGVRSWSSKEGRGFTKYAPRRPHDTELQSGKGQLFSFTVPNLTPARAQDLANAKQADITRHERLISFTAPGDLDLNPRDEIRVRGTNSDADQIYCIDCVTRRIGFDGGFGMSVRGKNHSAQTGQAGHQ